MIELTARDVEILEALTRRVRVLTLDQIARTWWRPSPISNSNAASRLKLLGHSQLIKLHRAPAHPELPLEEPVWEWSPGQSTPEFGSLSYRLQSRWTMHPVMTTCVIASEIAANRFNGHGGRFPRATERSHDIHLSKVYLRYRQNGRSEGWIFEEELRSEQRRNKERLPDAILERRDGTKIIEFGGAYPKKKIELFHKHCFDRALAYEVW